jgi:hypothetical protein
MEYIVGGFIAFIALKKLWLHGRVKAGKDDGAMYRNVDTRVVFNTDYGNDLTTFFPDTTVAQLARRGIELGDLEFKHGPDPEKLKKEFDIRNFQWSGYPRKPSTVPIGYSIGTPSL